MRVPDDSRPAGAAVAYPSTPESATAYFSGDAQGSPAEPEAQSTALVGAQLGQFRVEARIGQGGLGVVYRAYDVRLKRHVALKVLVRHRAQVDKLLGEARSAASLTHASIAAI